MTLDERRKRLNEQLDKVNRSLAALEKLELGANTTSDNASASERAKVKAKTRTVSISTPKVSKKQKVATEDEPTTTTTAIKVTKPKQLQQDKKKEQEHDQPTSPSHQRSVTPSSTLVSSVCQDLLAVSLPDHPSSVYPVISNPFIIFLFLSPSSFSRQSLP
jgi:hypothetical protein